MTHSHTIVEHALQPINEGLECIVNKHHAAMEKHILQILTLMASIRTRALERGWDENCERDLDTARDILVQCTQ